MILQDLSWAELYDLEIESLKIKMYGILNVVFTYYYYFVEFHRKRREAWRTRRAVWNDARTRWELRFRYQGFDAEIQEQKVVPMVAAV